eukprot:365595-Chlamydomonas_euryale.AAC.9
MSACWKFGTHTERFVQLGWATKHATPSSNRASNSFQQNAQRACINTSSQACMRPEQNVPRRLYMPGMQALQACKLTGLCRHACKQIGHAGPCESAPHLLHNVCHQAPGVDPARPHHPQHIQRCFAQPAPRQAVAPAGPAGKARLRKKPRARQGCVRCEDRGAACSAPGCRSCRSHGQGKAKPQARQGCVRCEDRGTACSTPSCRFCRSHGQGCGMCGMGVQPAPRQAVAPAGPVGKAREWQGMGVGLGFGVLGFAEKGRTRGDPYRLCQPTLHVVLRQLRGQQHHQVARTSQLRVPQTRRARLLRASQGRRGHRRGGGARGCCRPAEDGARPRPWRLRRAHRATRGGARPGARQKLACGRTAPAAAATPVARSQTRQVRRRLRRCWARRRRLRCAPLATQTSERQAGRQSRYGPVAGVAVGGVAVGA